MSPIRILIADDHAIVRDGLRRLLEADAFAEVVAEVGDGREAIRVARELRPDVVLMDVAMPESNGAEATRRILEDNPEIRVIALSMHTDRQYVSRMLQAGASGYVLKEGAFEELAEAVRCVRRGEAYLSPKIAGAVVRDYREKAALLDGQEAESLSPREREVLQLLAEGRSTKDIAATLHLSVKTVETHRKRMMDKLSLTSVAELTKFAIRQGLTSLE